MKRFAGFVPLSLLILTGCAGDNEDNQANEADQDTQSSEEAALEEEIALLEAELEDVEAERNELLDQVADLEQELGEMADGEETGEEAPSPFADDWTPHGDRFYDQVWMYQEQTELEADAGFERESLDWRDAFGEASETFNETHGDLATAESLLYTWLGERNMLEHPDSFDELTVRMNHQEDNLAEAVVLKWGLRDDAIAGEDFRLTLEEIDGSWEIADIEVRVHCRRGTTEMDGEVLCQ
ncbi:hypothetical protein [Salisediminibacterium selenitireducens]|uniref:Lipoprotein n=1 Tax=Bacillus selenitireducens (strain ATCC 700615 / DSM 15326 / MLS10) TaxID=439292 RepID=D6XX41_BACIE|nr:hypothetical protein [Salisediminibacterium selenitireducens]ADI00018.1 hypothetical protein Bsel_2516 [[Bacillus] selenitireducens MLS10]